TAPPPLPVQDDVDEELVRQPVHEPTVGEVGGLGREGRRRRSVAATPLAVTGDAVGGVQLATRGKLTGGRGGRANTRPQHDCEDYDQDAGGTAADPHPPPQGESSSGAATPESAAPGAAGTRGEPRCTCRSRSPRTPGRGRS